MKTERRLREGKQKKQSKDIKKKLWKTEGRLREDRMKTEVRLSKA